MPDVSEADVARELAERIYHACHLTPSDDTGLELHVVWECQQMMRNLSLRHDLTKMERMAFAVILAGANERKLRTAGPSDPGIPILGVEGEGPTLRAVS